jgi:hypothetical protein
MKTTLAIMMTLALAILSGCWGTSTRGGTGIEHEGFRINVPTFQTTVKQGDRLTITISLIRDSLFKQEVNLYVSPARGITVAPSRFSIKPTDEPDVQLQIAVPKDAPLGSYPVVVYAMPATGTQTSVGFTVKVVAP